MPMLWLHMKSTRSTQRPYGYVFIEGDRVIIRGSGPLGSRLMMAMSGSWDHVQCGESSRDGRSTWAIILNSGQGCGMRRHVGRLRGQAGWLLIGGLGSAGAGYLAAKGWWMTAALMACASVVVWMYASVRR